MKKPFGPTAWKILAVAVYYLPWALYCWIREGLRNRRKNA